ncbi:MAG: M15 family metallopeptidase [Propionibacteriaceae bacterium]|nr:M15 family metallopeptidase [Propionibacteriaceae bacterium]
MVDTKKNGTWGAEAALMAVCVIVAVAMGIVIAPRTLEPHPLDTAAPATATSIRTTLDTLTTTLAPLTQVIGQDTGVDAPGPDQSAGAGQQTYSSTWLAADDPLVTAVKDQATQCRTLVGAAQSMLDPAQTLVGMADQTDTSSTPEIVSSGQAATMATTLRQCLISLDRAIQDMHLGLESAKNSAAVSAASDAEQAARSSFDATLVSAQEVYDTTPDTSATEAPLAALSAQLADSNAVAAQIDSAEPPTTWQALDEQTDTIQSSNQALGSAVIAVQSVHVYTGKNGDLDPATLCQVPYDPKQLLRCDAEAAWMKLDAVYKQVWGVDIPIDLSYRTYDEQVEMKAIYGSGAATPGTSNHGWGTAVDLPDYRETEEGKEWNYGTPKYEWMKANAPAFGWINPSWAVEGGSGPHEPWHFEYVG